MNKNILLTTCAFATMSFAAPAVWAAAPAAPASTSSADTGTTIQELVVTAERRETNLQDTPIAVSAFSSDTLKNEKVNGGQDVLLQVPNTNYSRSNFGGFNLKIRGIGTDVVGRGGTSGVSINENEMPVTANNFQNTDFYDVERVEVLRGPQGTLYGRNSTGGAVDIITAKPTSEFGGFASLQYSNYNSIKATGAVNIPLGDAFAVRIAGFRLVQDGVGTNTFLGAKVDGRDLGSARVTLSFKPNDRFSAYLMYEHYGEDDTRNRVGKQLCISDPGPNTVGGAATTGNQRAFLSQGCLPGSLYQNSAFGSLNSNSTLGGILANLSGLNNFTDLFATHPLQDHNLHNIESTIQPLTTSQQDLAELHLAYNLTDSLTLASITGFNRSVGTTAEDYNRLVPLTPYTPSGIAALLFPGGVVTDPQTGKSNKITSYDYGNVKSKEYTQEVRLTSSFKGPLNFSVGGFYSEIDGANPSGNYYVESNSLTAFTLVNNFAYDATYAGFAPFGATVAGNEAGGRCASAAAVAASGGGCVAVSGGAPLGAPLHVDSKYPPDGTGHNYYDSRTGGDHLKDYAGFLEVYYDITPQLKLTLGGRYTVDQLYNNQFPIELLSGAPNGGTTYPDAGFPISQYPLLALAGFPNGVAGSPTPAVGGFPTTICTTSTTACIVPQRVTYREFTGRANLTWTPTLSFTDKTLIYANYSRGYKGGGFNTACQASLGGAGGNAAACGYPLSYTPEFIDAYEVGTKNTVLGGSAQINLTGFYYNYKGYQVSRIISESSVNFNYNAKIYGVEFEGLYSPIHNLTLNANIGYTHSALDSNQFSQDSLNLTQGNAAYTFVKETGGQNCLAPTATLAAAVGAGIPGAGLNAYCFGGAGLAGVPIPASPDVLNPDGTRLRFGVSQNLGGNKLPNTPDVTVAAGAQYVFELPGDWKATIRGDYYWQDKSFSRVYNTVNDVLQSYHVVNATLTFANVGDGLDLQFYVKNAFNAQPITGVYLTDPTSGLFQNVFTLDPRFYGAQITKRF